METTACVKHRYNYKHGLSNERLYHVWYGMMYRCYNPNCEGYKNYGGRGIVICDEWRNDYFAFKKWAYESGYDDKAPKGVCTIDRIDVNGNYEPSNCRWATTIQQGRNTRRNLLVTYNGETKPLSEWCEELNLKYDPIHNRIEKGWDVTLAFNTPLSSEYESFASICRRHGINPGTARDRIVKFGWTFEEAINTPSRGRGTHRSAEHGYANCKICGKEFHKRTAWQIYCGEQCYKEASKTHHKKIQHTA